MFRTRLAKKSSKKIIPRFFTVAVFVGLMLILLPYKTNAQGSVVCVNCSTFTEQVAEWAKTVAQYASQAAEWVTDHLLWASAASSNVAGQTALAQGQLVSAQANVDATTRVPYMQQTAGITVAHSMLTGSHWCYATMETSALDQVRKAKEAMLTAFENSFMQVGAGGDDLTAKAARVKFKCDEAFLDPSDTSVPNGANLLKSINCTPPSHGGQFVGKHNDINSVIGTDELYMPANTTESTSNGKLLTLPKAAAATDTEMPAIAALSYCMLRHARTAMTVSRTSGVSLTNVGDFEDQDEEKADANVPSQSCLEQVTDRMAVGSGATGQLQNVYQAQASLCLYMNKTGKLTSTENANCQSNGMSWINAQIHLHCATGRTDYVIFRAGQGSTVDNITDELNKGGDQCTRYKNEVAASAHAFEQSTQMVNRNPTMTKTNEQAR